MERLIMHPQNKDQLQALKAIAKAWKIGINTQKSPYHPDFVTMVKKLKSAAIILKLTLMIYGAV